jgi:small-conductance mechanosensitive channel/CRP-like cAMP-binding protein
MAATTVAHIAFGIIATLLLLPFHRRVRWRRAVIWVWLALFLHWLAITLGTPTISARIAATVHDLLGLTTPAELIAKLLIAVAQLAAVWAGLQVLEVTVWETYVRRRKGAPIPQLVWDLLAFVVMAFAVMRSLAVDFDVDLTTLLVTSSVVSVVVGLALQDTLRNLIAGIALQTDPPFSIGEWVKLGEHEGEVVQFNWRTLAIRTRENNIVVLPNGTVAAADIINYGRPGPTAAFDIYVGVAYPHPPGEVKAVLAEAAAEAEGVSPYRSAGIFVDEYADFAVVYRMRIWIEDWSQRPQVKDAVLRRVWYRLKRHDMVIPFPIRDINLRAVREDAERIAQLDREDAIRSVLRPLSLFSSLRDDQVDELASASTMLSFTSGEALFQQGALGTSLYVLRSGRVRVDVEQPGSAPVTIAQRGPGDFIGEMSLLTGEPRSATVVSEAETEVVIVPSEAVAAILLDDPDVMHGLSEALTERVLERDVQLAEAAGKAAAHASMKAQLLERMRRFFLK